MAPLLPLNLRLLLYSSSSILCISRELFPTLLLVVTHILNTSMSPLSSLSVFTLSVNIAFQVQSGNSPQRNPVQPHIISQHHKAEPCGGLFSRFLQKQVLYFASASGNKHCNVTTKSELSVTLRTPHSGYHFDGSTCKFFEGWYFKVSIPEKKKSFCFIYSVENPAFKKKLCPSELARYGPRPTGVGVQILGADDEYICRFSEESDHFWGCWHDLALGNTFLSQKDTCPPDKEVSPEDFSQMVLEGFQASAVCNQGYIQNRHSGRMCELGTVKYARWKYYTCPSYGWGNVGAKQKATEGWMAAFSVFEPHWQICMARGISTGWIEWDGERYDFQNAPSYAEKNWGEAFPTKWFWIQCNVFEGREDVALTAAGGRKLPGLGKYLENAALIGIHHGGDFYEFAPWNGVISWEIDPWGFWLLYAENKTHMVQLKASAEACGTMLLAPTAEKGMAPICKDSCHGSLRLQLWKRSDDGRREIILDCSSDMAAVEVGGSWVTTWKGETPLAWLVRGILQLSINIKRILSLILSLKPPVL